MENQQKFQPHFRLLPNYFKKIGIGFLFAFIILELLYFYQKKFDPAIYENYRDIYDILFSDILIIGLFFISIAKEKIEDELIMLIRLQSIAKAFILGIVFVIGTPILGYFWHGHIQEVQGQNIIVGILTGYITFYYMVYLRKEK